MFMREGVIVQRPGAMDDVVPAGVPVRAVDVGAVKGAVNPVQCKRKAGISSAGMR